MSCSVLSCSKRVRLSPKNLNIFLNNTYFCDDLIRNILTYLQILEIVIIIIRINNCFKKFFFNKNDKNITMVKKVVSQEFGNFITLENRIEFNFFDALQNNVGYEYIYGAYHMSHFFKDFSKIKLKDNFLEKLPHKHLFYTNFLILLVIH